VTASQDHTIATASEAETIAAGERFARSLPKGAVLLLYGQLGAGKTAFVRGLARGLGANPDDVSSPTFTLIQEYRVGAEPILYHVDLYRLNPAEVDDLGLDDLMDEDAVMAIEWAERWRHQPADAIDVTIEDEGADKRRIVIQIPTSSANRPS
jgi:tRNA threonylcarbamoyladenosine biosynthesis protein TsaE